MENVIDYFQEREHPTVLNVYIFGSSSVLSSSSSVPPKDLDMIIIRDSSRYSFRTNADFRDFGWIPETSNKEFPVKRKKFDNIEAWGILDVNFEEMMKDHIPVAMECIFNENPLTPKAPFVNKIDYRSRVKIDPNKLYNSFVSVAIHHWAVASQLYIFNFTNVKEPEAVYNIAKKFACAIRFLDFGTQILQKGKINDFNLCDEIRTKINNNTFTTEEDFFNIFVDVWQKFGTCANKSIDDKLETLRRGFLMRKQAVEAHLRSIQPKNVPDFHVENSSIFSPDIWTEILLQLPRPTDIANASQVCKLWHKIINSLQFIDKILLPYTGSTKQWKSNSEAINFFKRASFLNKFEPNIPWKCVICKEYPREYAGTQIIKQFNSLYEKYSYFSAQVPTQSNNHVLLFSCGCRNEQWDYYSAQAPVTWGCVHPDILPLLRTASMKEGKHKCLICGSVMQDAGRSLISWRNMFMCCNGHLIERSSFFK